MALRRLDWAQGCRAGRGGVCVGPGAAGCRGVRGAHPAPGPAPAHPGGGRAGDLARRPPPAHRGGVGRAAGAAARRGQQCGDPQPHPAGPRLCGRARPLPAGLCELEEPPEIAAQVLLAAMDRQQVTLQRVDAAPARLRVKLPLRAAPASGRDWAWHVIDLRLPATVGPEAVLHTPTLRPTRSRADRGGPAALDAAGRRPGRRAHRGARLRLGRQHPAHRHGRPPDRTGQTRRGWSPTAAPCSSTPPRSARNCTGCAATANTSPPDATTTARWRTGSAPRTWPGPRCWTRPRCFRWSMSGCVPASAA